MAIWQVQLSTCASTRARRICTCWTRFHGPKDAREEAERAAREARGRAGGHGARGRSVATREGFGMSGTVHYKFKSALNFSSIAFDGGFISVSDLKKTIAEKSGLASSTDTDLEVSNAQTNEVYRDETFLIPKNTSVLVRRVPAVRKGAVLASTAPKTSVQQERTTSHAAGAEDNFGGDLFEKGGNEDDAIANLVTGTANGWQKEIQASKLRVRGKGRGRGELPPPGYVCHRCGQSGHYIMNCPTNGDPEYDVKKVRHPVGIPVTRLVTSGEGGLMLPSGETGALAVNDLDFLNQVVAPSTVLAGDRAQQVPSELQCPICKKLFNDAVLIPCCQESYCDPCIREHLIAKNKCPNCGQTDVLCDSLLPNRHLRKAVDGYLAKLQDEGIIKHGAVEGAKPFVPGAQMPRLAGVTEQIMVPAYEDPQPQPEKQADTPQAKEAETEPKQSIPELDMKETGDEQEFKEKSASPPPPEVLRVLEGDQADEGHAVPLGKEQKRRQRDEKKCFHCKEPGHIARECPQAPPSAPKEEGKKKGYGPNGMFPFPVPEAPTDLMNYAFNRSEPLTLAEFEEMQVQGRRMYGYPPKPPSSAPLPPPPPLRPAEVQHVRDAPAGPPSKRRREEAPRSSPSRARTDRPSHVLDPSDPSLGAEEDRRGRRGRRPSAYDDDRRERTKERDVDVRGRDRFDARVDRERRGRSRSVERTRGGRARGRGDDRRGEPVDLRDTLLHRRRRGGSPDRASVRGFERDVLPPPPPPPPPLHESRKWDDRRATRDRPPSPLRRGGHRIVWKPRG